MRITSTAAARASPSSKASALPPSAKPSNIIAVATPACNAAAMAASRSPARPPLTSVVGVALRSGAAAVLYPFFRQLARLHAELLKLAVQMGALQAGLFGHARHAAAFAAQVVLEIHALEGVARLAQRQVERQVEQMAVARSEEHT